MARKPTPYVRGGVYHIYSRGNNKQRIFLDDRDYLRFLAELDCQRFLTPFVLYAYCLMPNHFHLVLRVLEVSLDRFLQPMLTRYAKAFNRRWDRVGHVFQDRFGRKPVTTDAYFRQAIAYVHFNPVKDGFASEPGAWPWSSHSEYLSTPVRVDSDYALSLFGPTKPAAVAEYMAKLPAATENPFTDEDFAETDGFGEDRSATQTLAELSSSIAVERGLEPHDLLGGMKGRDIREARYAFLLQALRLGHSQTAIAAHLGRSPSALCEMIARLRAKKPE